VWVATRHRIRRHAKVNNVLPARHVLLPALAVLLASPLAACGGSDAEPASAASVSAPAAPPGPQRVVLLDPGHNSGNATHLAEINKQVRDGRGGTKPCNTVGTATAGSPADNSDNSDDSSGSDSVNYISEHTFNWDVADDLRELLESNGIKVIMTRAGDPTNPRNEAPDGVGPCVDARGEMAAQVNADLEVSIHADGAPAADHGFHVIYSKPTLNTAQGEPSISLATAIRNGMTDQQLTPANYVGKKGLIGRNDLAGLNLATRPSVLIECGNMKNPQDSINMRSDAGQARIAQGIGTGIMNWLAQNPPGSLALAQASPLQSSDSESPPSTTLPNTTTTRRHHGSSTSSTSKSKSTKKTTSEKTPKTATEHPSSTPSTDSNLPG
jgi:N-acetylmuramoyl-L-alanine amidase